MFFVGSFQAHAALGPILHGDHTCELLEAAAEAALGGIAALHGDAEDALVGVAEEVAGVVDLDLCMDFS